MVNQVVYEYLRQYSGKFRLEDIKNKILSSGYSEEDFYDAAIVLNLIKKPSVSLNQKLISMKKIRAIKISAILSSVLFIFSLILFGSWFFYSKIIYSGLLNLSLRNNRIIFGLIIGVIMVLLCLIQYGYLTLGKITSKKMIKISSILMIIMYIFGYFFLVFLTFQGVLDKKIVGGILVVGGEPAPENFFRANSKIILSTFASLIMLFYIFFLISLISIRNQKWTLLTIIFKFLLIIGLIAIGLISFLNPDVINIYSEFSSKELIVPMLLNLFLSLSLVFQTISLLKYSRVYEN